MKYLIRHVVKLTAPQWYEIGLELFDEKDEPILKIIKIDCDEKVKDCCRKMFTNWLDREPGANWNQLIQVLRFPHIGLNELATTLEQRLLKITDKGNIRSKYIQM